MFRRTTLCLTRLLIASSAFLQMTIQEYLVEAHSPGVFASLESPD